jgi:prevent-host-death family protein
MRTKDIRYGVRELRGNLSQALREVKRGARVIITSRGRPVATITKVDASVGSLPASKRKLLRLPTESKLVLTKRDRIPDYTAPAIVGLSNQLLKDCR